MRKLRSLAVSVFILIVGFYGLSFFWTRAQMQGTVIPVDEVFESLIADPIPTAVTQLQGAKSSFITGYKAFMRFQAPSPAAAGLTSPPYEPVDCAVHGIAFLSGVGTAGFARNLLAGGRSAGRYQPRGLR